MGSPIDQLFPQETLAALRNAPMPPYKGREPSEIELKRIEQATGLTLPSIRAYAFRAVTLLAVGCGNPDLLGAQPPIQRLGLFLCPSCVLRVLTGGAWARFGVAGFQVAGFPPHAPSVAHSPWKENATVQTFLLGVRHG
ncbi:hypothetical protein SAMN02949497_3550 [Methylomagnum ishizawai]|uniref:Uncharacterized protein n=1 Tax=Methylomagnum ishizawai TaxID=1760988 RepID=A0A1Y6D8R7_9GAMM|nr:hypothetical protein [Methylomagnum ishizawai]SMF96165.1 hypothetical protein SAMN02949497_3550 [Methylomagnum ishizawai]